METTFITIHDLTPDARLLYVSNSIADILGFKPGEVVGKSCWEYFHPDEIPFARAIHGRGIQLDKAAVLNYCQIKNANGLWVGCECVFTIVYDCLVGCTSVYKRSFKSQNRAADAPIIRQVFSSSPKDPRYHMLSYISTKFNTGPKPHIHEPRAALFLNRFTRTLTIMYATNGLEKLLGVSADELRGQSFYFCIQEGCLHDAINCLERAKANDSIAYLRFWYRDPRQDNPPPPVPEEPMSDAPSVNNGAPSEDMDVDEEEDDEGGGVQLASEMDTDSDAAILSASSEAPSVRAPRPRTRVPTAAGGGFDMSTTTSPMDSSSQSKTPDAIFDPPAAGATSIGSSRSSEFASRQSSQDAQKRPFQPRSPRGMGPPKTRWSAAGPNSRPIELEAVVSCTSDGLVVILRHARPLVPDSLRPAPPRLSQPQITTTAAGQGLAAGIFAAPWSLDPAPGGPPAPTAGVPMAQPSVPAGYATPAGAAAAQTSGGADDAWARSFMDTIREVAVFAWALTGINGSLAAYSRGKPRLGAQPYGGLPIWEKDSTVYGDG